MAIKSIDEQIMEVYRHMPNNALGEGLSTRPQRIIYNYEQIVEMLKRYGESIINECAESARVDVMCSVVDDSSEGCHDEIRETSRQWNVHGGDWSVKANKERILALKNQII